MYVYAGHAIVIVRLQCEHDQAYFFVTNLWNRSGTQEQDGSPQMNRMQ